jgi:hypothetical protein
VVPDPESGRCLVRPTTANPGNGGPAAGAVRGSWSAYSLLASGSASGGSSAVESSLSGALSQPGAQVSGPLGYGLGSLLSQASGGGGASGPGAQAGWSGASALASVAPNPQVGTRGSAATRGASGGLGTSIGGSNAGGPGNPMAMSLSATQLSPNQVQLNWNQLGGGGAAGYEVRRCSSLNSPTVACTLVAVVQAGSYLVTVGQGTYLVRAVGSLGQVQGESNRVQVCCGG